MTERGEECPACKGLDYGQLGADHVCPVCQGTGHKPTDAPRSAGVRRFSMECDNPQQWPELQSWSMAEDADGDYILATDHEARVAALEADNGRLREALEHYADDDCYPMYKNFPFGQNKNCVSASRARQALNPTSEAPHDPHPIHHRQR